MPGPGILNSAVRQGISQPAGANATPPPPGGIAAPAPEGRAQEGGDQAGEEKYGQLIDNVSKLIDGEKGFEEGHSMLMGMLEEGKSNPGQALAKAVTAAGDSIMKQADGAGVDLSGDLIVAAAMDSLELLADLASEAGFFEASEEDLASAYEMALLQWMQAHPEMIDWNALQADLQNIDQQTIDAAHQMFGSPGAQGAPGGGAPGGPTGQPGGPGAPGAGVPGPQLGV